MAVGVSSRGIPVKVDDNKCGCITL
jgi:hypothetical protein